MDGMELSCQSDMNALVEPWTGDSQSAVATCTFGTAAGDLQINFEVEVVMLPFSVADTLLTYC